MARKIKPRIRVPKKAKAGETISIRSLINHRMESGQRKGEDGNPIPRKIINRFEVSFNGELVLDAELRPSISTDPYFKFDATVPETGEFHFKWTDDDGSVYETKKKVEVA